VAAKFLDPGIRFRFVLKLRFVTRDQLWTTALWPVDGLRGELHRFRKSHHLSLGRPREPDERELQSAAIHEFKARCCP
jgi:hypothetical protein